MVTNAGAVVLEIAFAYELDSGALRTRTRCLVSFCELGSM